MFWGLVFTLLVGLFFLVGFFVLNKVNNKISASILTISLAFIVMGGLLLLDLLPELIESKNALLIIPALLGFFLLVLLDKLLPHHHHEHDHCDKHDHSEHLNHIGTITIISLAIHNMIEGASLYALTLTSIESGIMMMIGISLHNIPLGFQIGNSLEEDKKNILLIVLLCLSALIGALIIIIFGNFSETVSSYLLAVTFGMLIYIWIFELFNEIKTSLKKKESIYGIIIGVIVVIITYLI